MHLNTDGWLDIAEPLASPHHNDRPDADDISLLVIHNISLPPQEYGDRYISVTNIPIWTKSATCALPPTSSSCATATSNNTYRLPPAPGTPVPPLMKGGKTATISA